MPEDIQHSFNSIQMTIFVSYVYTLPNQAETEIE